jgi:hypothetical protein
MSEAIDFLCGVIIGALVVAQLWRVWDADREYREALAEYEELKRRHAHE